MQDPFATSRNGHKLENMYDGHANTLDIRYKGLYPSNVLSNLYANEFTFDGVRCASIEGFLQSLKYADEQEQIRICGLHGGSAKDKSTTSWQQTQTLWWKGKPYKRESREFTDLLLRVYTKMLRDNATFRNALLSTQGIKLIHTLGISDPKQTILTDTEFCNLLTTVRETAYKDERKRRLVAYICTSCLIALAIVCIFIGMHGHVVYYIAASLLLVSVAATLYHVVHRKVMSHKLSKLARREDQH